MLGLSWTYAQCIWRVCIMCTVYLHLYSVVVEGVKMVHAQEFCLGGATPYGPVQTVLKGHGMPWAISSVPDPKNSGSHPHSPAIPVLSSNTTTERWWSAGPQLPNISRTCGTASTFVPLWIEVWRRVQVQAYLGGFKYDFLPLLGSILGTSLKTTKNWLRTQPLNLAHSCYTGLYPYLTCPSHQ